MVKRVSYFISPHGFGHAARACAVIEAMWEINPLIRFSVFTSVPLWFFLDSLSQEIDYNSLVSDVGLVQKSPLKEDLEATIQRLDAFYPLQAQLIESIKKTIDQTGRDLVICDIAPLGIQVGKSLGIPTVLIENFTWNWIYQGYDQHYHLFEKHISYLSELYAQVDYHILAKPFCYKNNPDLVTGPISRKFRTPAKKTREALDIPSGKKLVTITMGGIQEDFTSLHELKKCQDVHFLIPGGGERIEQADNITLLPHRSTFFHPDLIEASDVVIGKIGYSTLSEVFQSGRTFGYIPREQFRESKELERFIQNQMNSEKILEQDYHTGVWVEQLENLFSKQRQKREEPSGADQVAAFLCQLPVLT